jgi:quinol monooxygenase YgiN
MNTECTRWTLLIMLLLVSFLTGGTATAQNGTPYYRFWRGFKKPDISREAFVQALIDDFMPATVQTHGQEGLMSYMVILPPASAPWNIPDEIALVAYASEDIYKTITTTPHGRAYQIKHGDIFTPKDNPATGALIIPGQSRGSRSLVPRPFAEISPEEFRREAAYDVLSQPVDWQTGHSMFFMGLRKPSLRPDFFWDALYRHIQNVRTAFPAQGLKGYLVLADPNYEIALLNWESREAMEKALNSPAGQALEKEALGFVDPLLWQQFRAFDGTLQTGDCVNYLFSRPDDKNIPPK